MVLMLSGGGMSEAVTNKFLEMVSGSKAIGVIANAREKGEYESTVEWVKEKLLHGGDGFDVRLIDLENPSFESFGGIIIGGGNTFKLLRDLREAGVESKLIDFAKSDKPIYGISAGAIIMGKDISTAHSTDKNEIGLRDLSGLGLFPDVCFECHFEATDAEKLQKLAKEKNVKIIAFPEDVGLIWNLKDDSKEYIGDVSVFEG